MHQAAEASPSLFQWSFSVSALEYLNVSVTWTWKGWGHSNRVVASVKPTLMPLCGCMCRKIKEICRLRVASDNGKVHQYLPVMGGCGHACQVLHCSCVCAVPLPCDMCVVTPGENAHVDFKRRPLRERTGLCLDGVIMAIGVPAWALYIRTCRYKKQWEFYIFGAGSACVCLTILFTCGNERRRRKKKNSICIPETVSTLSSVICVGN